MHLPVGPGRTSSTHPSGGDGPTVAVSSFSLHRSIGPLRLVLRDEVGKEVVVDVPAQRNLSLGDFADQVRSRFGVTAVELCQIQVPTDEDAVVAEFAERLRVAGVGVLTVCLDIGDLGARDAGLVREDVQAHLPWFDRAVRLGCRFVRVNAGSPVSRAWPEVGNLVGALDELADAASSRGLSLLVENHGGASSHPQFLLDLVSRVGPDRLGVLLDLGNFPVVLDELEASRGREGDRPLVDHAPVFAAIDALAPVAHLVHAKSYGFRPDGTPEVLDTGATLSRALARGFRGPVSIEYEGTTEEPWTGTQRTLDLVRRALEAGRTVGVPA